MKKIAEIAQRKLKWSQPKALKREYELRADRELVATLKYRSAWGSFAIAESADGCWTFKRVGFWQTKATIRASGSDTDVAVFNNNTWANGGTLELTDGRKYPATSNFWQRASTPASRIAAAHIRAAYRPAAALTRAPPSPACRCRRLRPAA